MYMTTYLYNNWKIDEQRNGRNLKNAECYKIFG